MLRCNNNVLLMTDTYKLGHQIQYPEDTTEVYSYLEARKKDNKVVFFGLQYYLMEYLSKPITLDHVEEFVSIYESMLGPCPKQIVKNMSDLAELGHWPLQIKAVPEGSLVDSQNVLMTLRNTKIGFHWIVGFLESMLLKVWNECTVATASLKYKNLIKRYAKETCDNLDHIPFATHDFSFRGMSSEESAAKAGSSHLINFYGSDTVTAIKFLDKYYEKKYKETIYGLSVPASEHSVMCSYGKENEIEAFRHMLKTYPEGIVSIVSDTYDLWNVLENFTEILRSEIENRNGKVVFRPDSGNPLEITIKSLEILWRKFGGTINSKGYRILNPKVGLIYGDGMYYQRFEDILRLMKEAGFASSNLVIGVGSILCQQHNRDEYGFAIKATRIVRNGKEIEVFKDPITDPGKKSKKGLMALYKNNWKEYYTKDQLNDEEEKGGLLETVFLNGNITKFYSIEDVRAKLDEDQR